MSCQFRRFPVQPNHIPMPTMMGGTAVTTPLAMRSTTGIETGLTFSAGTALRAGPIGPPCL